LLIWPALNLAVVRPGPKGGFLDLEFTLAFWPC
jgi:hypothetical protein